jgi:hypothetical protein
MTIARSLLIASTTLLLLTSFANAAELTAAQKRDIIFECQQLVTDYAYYRDLRDADNVAALFTEDARMLARGHWNVGHQELRDHVNNDDMSTVSLHLITTIKIMPQDENTATGITYAAVAHEAKGEDESAPVPLEAFAVIGKYHDTFVRTDKGWKISERAFRPTFRKPPADTIK